MHPIVILLSLGTALAALAKTVCLNEFYKQDKMSTVEAFLASDVECLYHLKGNPISLIEIKRLNVPKNRPKAEIYSWILFEDEDHAPRILEFDRMVNEKGPDGKVQRIFRFFKDSSLVYDSRDQIWHYRINNVYHILWEEK